MSDTSKRDRLTIPYALIQCFFWMTFGNVSGFASVYLLDNGFSNTQIGVLIAAVGILAAVAQPLLAGYADKENSPSVRIIIAAAIAVHAALAVLLLAVDKKAPVLTLTGYGCLVFIMQIMTPFINALGMESINQNKEINFGVARGIGSAGYAVVSYVIGIAVAKVGTIFLPISIAVVSVALLVNVLLFPFQKKQKEAGQEEEETAANPFLFMKKYKRFCVTLCGCVLIYISHVILNNFTFQIVESKGGGSAQMGTAMAMAALVELPTAFLFVFMLKKARCDIWLRISGFFFFLKALGTLLASNIPVFYGVQILQMFGWALISVSSVYYVNSIMEKQDAIKGQAYFTMTYTLATVIGSLLGGGLLDVMGVGSMLVFAIVSAVAGAVIVILSSQRTD